MAKEKTCGECGSVMMGSGSMDNRKLKPNKDVIKIDMYEDKEADERLSNRANKSGYAKNYKEEASSKKKGKKDPMMDMPRKKIKMLKKPTNPKPTWRSI
jgi:hypothetical protein